MIFHHLHHRMPVYKDCTLAELFMVAFSSLVVMTIIFCLITQILFGILWIGYLIAALLIVPITRILLGRLQKIKYGKPYGFYQHLFLRWLQQTPLNHFLLLPFVIRVGRWGVRRT